MSLPETQWPYKPIAEASRLERAIRTLAIIECLALREDEGENRLVDEIYVLAHAGFGMCGGEMCHNLARVEELEKEFKEAHFANTLPKVEKFLQLVRIEGDSPRHQSREGTGESENFAEGHV